MQKYFVQFMDFGLNGALGACALATVTAVLKRVFERVQILFQLMVEIRVLAIRRKQQDAQLGYPVRLTGTGGSGASILPALVNVALGL